MKCPKCKADIVINEEKLKIIIDEYLGDSYKVNYLARTIVQKQEEWIK